jgi:hypothetical protein
MTRKDLLAPAALLCAIAISTIFAAGSQPKATVTGTFAQYLVPAVLTVWFLALIANARAIMDLLASFFLGNRKGQDSGGSWGVFIGYAIALVAILILLRTQVLQNFLASIQRAIAASSGGLQKTPPGIAEVANVAANPLLLDYTLLIFGGVILVSFTLFFGGLRTAHRWARDEHSPFDAAMVRLEARKVVQTAMMDLKLSKDYRETILNCYRRMCFVLSSRGFNIRPQETASEFSDEVSRKLELGGEAVKGLTVLFEQARYSDHEINDQQRGMAISRLECLERLLTSAGS